ncbi:hypothetical protein RSOLAG22IIIB_11449 [Rhizoctonia solani]|uniref:C2H2-type domain-containing protein n=1 Tax=Rhizoctonia solani TaxID=456999 RepID=A0A0K6G8N8_9AGAM|nr:hypothetical protein RSOLAG22IIIB_11449 [Rhizoctonia solani]
MGHGDRYYFCSWIDWYYVDDSHNAYYEDGTLLHDALFAIHSDQFAIDQIPYYFYENGLWSQDPDGSFYLVRTWYQKSYFHTPSGLHYFDYRRNVFSDDGTLVCASASVIGVDGLLPVTFCISGTMYSFKMDELWCQASTDKCYRVHTWQSELNQNFTLANRKHHFYVSNILYYLDEYHNLYSEDGKLVCTIPSSLATDELGIQSFQIGDAPFWLHKDGLLAGGDDGILCRVLAWPKDSCASDGKSDSLQKGLLEGIVSWSPGSFTLSSPSVGASIDDCQMQSAPSLFPESQPDHTRSSLIASPRHNIIEKFKVQPARKRGNKDHLKCPYCGKECRRPIALKEHIRAHAKYKSQVCPFVDPNTGIACDTGFCTKQNKSRHFSTHRAGTLEEYLGLPPLPPRKKNTTVASEPFAPYNPYRRHPPPMAKKQQSV